MLRSSTLDQAADGHSNYLGLNNAYGAVAGLTQTAGSGGFTGASTTARVSAAAFNGAAQEIAIGSERLAVDGVRAALAAPYRRLALMDHGLADVGLGFIEPGATRPAGSVRTNLGVFWGALVATSGVRSAALPQAMLGSPVSVYPPDGATQVPIVMYPDVPNPVAAELGNWGDPSFPGYVVSLQVPRDKDLVVSTFTLSQVTATGNIPVLPKLLDANDTLYLRPNNIRNWAFLVPLTKLVQGATYEATFNGTAGGASLSKTWRFSTRDGFTASAPEREPVSGPTTIRYLNKLNVVVEEAVTSLVNIRYTTPSGVIKEANPNDTRFNTTYTNCGAGYEPIAVVGTQTVTLIETTVTAAVGCTVTLRVTDLGTLQENSRTHRLN